MTQAKLTLDWAPGTEPKPVFFGEWDSLDDMKRDWDGLTDEELEGHTILVAVYEEEGYGGSAFVLSTKDGRLFESHAGHCSCYGLEWDGWEDATPEALRMRRYRDSDEVKNAVFAVLDAREGR